MRIETNLIYRTIADEHRTNLGMSEKFEISNFDKRQ